MFNVNDAQAVAPEEEKTETAPFLIQYITKAAAQLSRLSYAVSTSVQQKLDVVSAVNPHAHGDPDPVMGHRDRRIITIDDVTVTFWISIEVRVLTVMRIQQSGENENWPTPHPDPPKSVEFARPGPFITASDDEDEEPAAIMGT